MKTFSILDRYILQMFWKGILLAGGGTITLFLLSELIQRLPLYIDKHIPVEIIILYHLYQLPSITVMVLPIGVLLSSFLTVSTFVQRRELVAMKGAGLSLYRIFTPLYISGMILFAIILITNDVLVPIAFNTQKQIEREKIYGLRGEIHLNRRNIMLMGEGGCILHSAQLLGRKGEMRKVSMYFPAPTSNKLIKRIDAKKAVYDPKEGWVLKDVKVRIFTERGESLIFHPTLKCPWIIQTPREIAFNPKEISAMSYAQLKNHIKKLEGAGIPVDREKVELYSRISYPLICLVIIIVGTSMAASTRETGFIGGFSLTLLVSFLYWGTIQMCKALGFKGSLSALLASWLPNIIFFTIGILLLRRAPK